jgi:serine/threonine protein kinase/lipopolysaccharide biosynthesis regulator YciM
MSEDQHQEADGLSFGAQYRISQACDAFEAQWRAGEQPRIEDFLLDFAEAEHPALLLELIALEIEFRREIGETPSLREYHSRFPDHCVAVDRAFKESHPERRPRPRRSQPRGEVDHNLLFGILALQNNFIDREALVSAFNTWIADKNRPLGKILQDRGALESDDLSLLEALVAKHLERFGNDPKRSLASLSSIGSVRDDLSSLGDDDIQESLCCCGAGRDEHRGYDTVTPPTVGEPTSAGTRFRILRPHARGGIGEVFLAHDTELNRDVALKGIQEKYADDRHSRTRFVYEAEVTGGLEHPGIVTVYGLGQTPEGRPFYAMRFIKGDSLKDAIKRFHEAEQQPKRDPGERTLALRELLGRFIDVCDAIAFAHSRRVLHRDLKPGNIMLGKYGETLVVDWGLAKEMDRSEADAPSKTSDHEPPLTPASGSSLEPTIAGVAVGTPAYMSPEQIDSRHFGPVGVRSDVYCLGATLFHLLTGRAPCVAGDVGEVYQKVLKGDISPPRSLNPRVAPALEAICLKAMSLQPQDRYATARDLAQDIERWMADEWVSAYREPPLERARRWGRRHIRLLTGLTAAAAVGLVALGILTTVISNSNRNLAVARGEAVKQRDQAKAVTQFLVTSLRRADPAEDGRKVTIAEVLADAIKTLEKTDVAPTTKAEILDAVAETYRGLGLAPESVAAGEKAVALLGSELGDEHADTLIARANLANSYKYAGMLDRAIPLFEEVLRVRRSKFGDNDVDTLIAKDNLAAAYNASDRLDLALPLHREAVEGLRIKVGPDDLKTLLAMNNLALTLKDNGQVKDAIQLYKEIIERGRHKLPENHPERLIFLDNLAVAYEEVGQIEDAIELHTRIAEAEKLKLGEDHPDTLISMTSLAVAYLRAGDIGRAVEILEAVAEATKAKRGKDHPATLSAMNGLAEAYRAAGRLDRALRLHEQTLAGRKSKLGDDHDDTVISMINLALTYQDSGQVDRAIPLLENAVRWLQVKRGREHPDTLTSKNNLANTHMQMGQIDEALREFDEILQARRTVLGGDHPSTLTSINNYAVALYKSGQPLRTVTMLQDLVRTQQRVFGTDNPQTLNFTTNLGAAYREASQLDQAIPLLEKTLKSAEGKLGADHPGTLWTCRELAKTYERAHRENEAERLYRRVVDASSRQKPRNDRFYTEALSNLGRCLVHNAKFPEAVERLRECLKIKKSIQPNDWSTANAQSLLGESLAAQKAFQEAEQLLLAGHKALVESREKILPIERDEVLRDATARLVRLYEALNKPAEAEKWRKVLASESSNKRQPGAQEKTNASAGPAPGAATSKTE